MICVECSRPVDRTGYCTACGVWALDLAASGAMPRFTPAAAGGTQPAPQAARAPMPTIPEWGQPEPAEAEWELPPIEPTPQPVYEAPPTGFESAPPPMAPRGFQQPASAEVPPPVPPVTIIVPPVVPAPEYPAAAFPAAAPAPAPAPAAAPGPQAASTPTIDDLFSEPSHMPAPAAPAPALPFAFLPPPKAADRAEVAQPTSEIPFDGLDSDPEMTMVASRRGKTKFWTLDLPDGSVEVIVGSVIVGRAASPVPGRIGARLLSIEDPTRSVSKNHAIFTDESGVLLVEDLGSMNGIVVTRADGHETELSPGIRLRLDNGSTVELGDLLLSVHKN